MVCGAPTPKLIDIAFVAVLPGRIDYDRTETGLAGKIGQ